MKRNKFAVEHATRNEKNATLGASALSLRIRFSCARFILYGALLLHPFTASALDAASDKKPDAPPTITLSSDKAQLIGVRTAVADYRSLDRRLRTVGKVETDETRLAIVNTKISGWIKKLYVDFTGKEIKKDQPMLTVYSPDLVTAQEEYLAALNASKHAAHEAGGLTELESSRRDLLASSRRRLQLWDITDAQIAELEQTGKPQTEMTIYAPVDGIVLEKMAIAGAYIMPGMNLYKIADFSEIWVLADIYEYEAPKVKVGQSAVVTLPYVENTAYSATVSYIYPSVDPMSRTIKVRLVMKNPGLLLKPEMFANVELMVSAGSHLAIPTEAVLDGGNRKLAYVEKEPGVYELRVVKIGARGDGYVEVLKGIKKGERVVTSGNFLLDSESQLNLGQ